MSDDQIKSMLTAMCWEMDVLGEASRVEERDETFSVGILRIIKMKIEVASDEELMWSSRSDSKE